VAEPARVELTLLGQKLSLRSEASPEYLRALAAFVTGHRKSARARARWAPGCVRSSPGWTS
jgi:hypothetical protein